VRDNGADGNFTGSGGALRVTDRFGHEVVDEFGGGWGVHGNFRKNLRLARGEGDHSWSPK
jgi:hypothetical protein